MEPTPSARSRVPAGGSSGALELDCMPAGMELFPAASEDQWSLIKRVIDDCDYYIVIVAGRYGSVGPDGISYTETEYRHAVERKPAIGFYHRSVDSLPANKTERDPRKRELLEEFYSLIKRRVCKEWSSAAELGSVVSRSLVRVIKQYPATGWVRADNLPEEDVVAEIVGLRKRVQDLERDLQEAARRGPQGSEHFAQGTDGFNTRFTFEVYQERGANPRFHDADSLTWNEIASVVLPRLVHEGTENQCDGRSGPFLKADTWNASLPFTSCRERGCHNFAVADDDFQTIHDKSKPLATSSPGVDRPLVRHFAGPPCVRIARRDRQRAVEQDLDACGGVVTECDERQVANAHVVRHQREPRAELVDGRLPWKHHEGYDLPREALEHQALVGVPAVIALHEARLAAGKRAPCEDGHLRREAADEQTMMRRGAPVDVGVERPQRVCRAAGELPLHMTGSQR